MYICKNHKRVNNEKTFTSTIYNSVLYPSLTPQALYLQAQYNLQGVQCALNSNNATNNNNNILQQLSNLQVASCKQLNQKIRFRILNPIFSLKVFQVISLNIEVCIIVNDFPCSSACCKIQNMVDHLTRSITLPSSMTHES